MTAQQAGSVAAGLRLRAYKFARYKTKKKDGEDATVRAEVSLAVADVGAARKAFAPEIRMRSTASSSRANSSTSRRTFFIRKSLPAAPAS